MGKKGNTSARPIRTGAKQIASVEMTVRILEKRASLWTLQQIADSEGVTTRAITKRIEKALENAPKEPAEHLRNVLTEKVHYAMRAITERVAKGELAAIDRWYAGIERISRLQGVEKVPDVNQFFPLPAATLAMFEAIGQAINGESRLLDAPATLYDGQEGASEDATYTILPDESEG